MENKHPINELFTTIMENVRTMVDANTIIGQPIRAEGVTLLPISKLSFGFGSGGADLTVGKKAAPAPASNSFGGGGGAGAKLEPVAFLVVKGDSVRLLPVSPPASTTVDRVIDMVPEVMDKITGFIDKQQEKKAAAETVASDMVD